MFPEAPQAASCSRCSDAGVLGVVPGIIGSLQALEAVKLASGVSSSHAPVLPWPSSGQYHPCKLRSRCMRALDMQLLAAGNAAPAELWLCGISHQGPSSPTVLYDSSPRLQPRDDLLVALCSMD